MKLLPNDPLIKYKKIVAREYLILSYTVSLITMAIFCLLYFSKNVFDFNEMLFQLELYSVFFLPIGFIVSVVASVFAVLSYTKYKSVASVMAFLLGFIPFSYYIFILLS